MAVAKTKEEKEAYNKYLFPKDTYPYIKQKEIVLNEIIKDQKDDLTVYFDSIADSKVDLLKVILALEKENILRIKKIGGIEMYDKRTFVGQWSKKDHPYAEIQIIQSYRKPLRDDSEKKPNTETIKWGSLNACLDKLSGKILSVSLNNQPLYVLKDGLRNTDLILAAELIKANGGLVLKDNLLRAMGYQGSSDKNDDILHKSVSRLRTHGKITNIKVKRGEGYYLE